MNEVQKRDETPNLIISQMESQFAKVLPKILTPERFCRVVLSAINKNPALKQAIVDPRNKPSVLSAFMRCAEMGLEPDGRRATINCYKKGNTGTYDITLIPMFQGLAELAMRSGMISNIHADKVCENDDFSWDTGEIHHKIDFRKPRGTTYAYYCIVRFKDGSMKTETMSLEEVNGIRDRSSAYQASKRYGKTCPWITDPDEMGKKTVFRRCSKWLPLSPELRSAIEADDEDYTGQAGTIGRDKFAIAAGLTEDDVAPENPEQEQVIDTQAESVSTAETANENLFDDKK